MKTLVWEKNTGHGSHYKLQLLYETCLTLRRMVSEVWSSLWQYMNMKVNYVRQIARDIFEKYMHIIHWSKAL
jgi:hypothetical protein